MGVRFAGGIVGLGIAVIAIAGATLLPIPPFAIAAPVHTVKPVPAAQLRVCPGPALALAANAGAATRPSAIGDANAAYGTDGPDTQTHTLTPDADTQSGSQGPLALSVTTPKNATASPLFGGSQVQNVNTPDLAGLAAASCDEPTADSWLSAGSTALGQTSLLLLANPTAVDATVNLTIYTEGGMVDAPAAAGITVPAGSQKVIPLAGLAPTAAAPVVHVRTTGGQVVATLQQSYEQGIQPQGVELTGATGAPSRAQTITGMTIASMAAVQATQSAEAVGVNYPVVRILVPGTQAAQVTVDAVGETGTAAGYSYAKTVKAGSVAEIPLDRLKDGAYTVTVNSTVPVVASARTSVIGKWERDFAWFVSSQPLTGTFLAAVPNGPSPTMHFANSGSKPVTVTVEGMQGGRSSVTVPAEGAAARPLSPGDYRVSGADGLTGSMSFATDGTSSSFPLRPPGPLAAPVDVYPH